MKSLIAWFVDNPVAANLMMLILVVGGLLQLPLIHKEEFPNVEENALSISVQFRGAAPEEVERSVCVRIEEAIEGIDGIKRINATASEGQCSVRVELHSSAVRGKALDDVTAAVNAIDTFPREAERPVITEVTIITTVLELVVSGDTDERALKELAEDIRDDLTDLAEISQIELLYLRPYEISIEVSEQTLRQYGLTLGRIADAVRASAVDVPGGGIKTASGEVLMRAKGERYLGPEFEDIPVIARPDGTLVHLGEIATIVDGFEDTDTRARFDGKQAVVLRVQRSGKEDTLRIADAVKTYVAERRQTLPEGVGLELWRDESIELYDRLSVLLQNALSGLVLVVLTLTLFLKFRIALWVAAGLPIAILGAIMLFPVLGISISSVSIMGILLGLGILVDDAIVIGERIHAHELHAEDRRTAAIEGTSEVAVPVFFGVLTTITAFTPLLGLPGAMRDFFGAVGLTVVLCLCFSLLESQLILPAHLAHRSRKPPSNHALVQHWLRLQDRIATALLHFAKGPYRRLLDLVLAWRYLVLSTAVAVVILMFAMVASDRIVFQFFPAVTGDRVFANLELPEGTAVATTQAAVAKIEAAAEQLRAELDLARPLDQGASHIKHVIASIGTALGRGAIDMGGASGSHLAELGIELVGHQERGELSAEEVATRWRELTGPIPGAVSLTFSADSFSFGDPIDIQLRGRDVRQLGLAAAELRELLAQYDGVVDIADTYRSGKQELILKIRPEAEMLGLSQRDLGSQVRQAFYGEEAQRIQRGRDDVRVMVRYPEAERLSLGDFEQMRIRSASGVEVPSLSVADIALGPGHSAIQRVDGRNVIRVTAGVDRSATTPEKVLAAIQQSGQEKGLPDILARHPGVSFALAGEAENRADSIHGLVNATVVALLIIYALLAIPLRSYLQPLIIMSTIPFGMIGAILGHYLLNVDLMFFSLLGMVALAGVVVNANLVLVDYVNQQTRRGVPVEEAIIHSGIRRFRPILLTSLTTSVGLAPLIATSGMATMLFVPLAVSLACGVVFATLITLVLVPAMCMILADFNRWRMGTAAATPGGTFSWQMTSGADRSASPASKD